MTLTVTKDEFNIRSVYIEPHRKVYIGWGDYADGIYFRINGDKGEIIEIESSRRIDPTSFLVFKQSYKKKKLTATAQIKQPRPRFLGPDDLVAIVIEGSKNEVLKFEHSVKKYLSDKLEVVYS